METDVRAWLEALGLGHYARAFVENNIDFAILAELDEVDLKELGVSSLGHRKKLLAGIAALRATAETIVAPVRKSLSGERRQVTILFADLSGFTALSQSVDPEELHELVSGYLEIVDRIVIECGGTVDKHMGDAVMALFGAPVAHGDDPLRAARAALDIHEALARLSERVGRLLQAHIGIASGEVVAGGIGRAGGQDYTVLGDSVNLSARLVAAAGPGQTLISDEVYGALSNRAECDALGDMQFKGIKANVRVWCLRSISGEAQAASRSPFVGREAELEQFKGVISTCLARGNGQVIHVRGEAGIGKTRLVDEMRRLAEAQGFAVHRALVLDFGVGKGQDPIRNIVRSLFNLTAGAGAEERLGVAERALATGLVTAERLAFLYDLLDLPPSGEWRALYAAMDNAARNHGKRALVAALTEHSCRRSPVLIIIEDLHWADPLLLGHLAALAVAVASGPGLLVITARVEGDPVDPAWRSACRGTPFATIDLGPLRRDEALNLAGSFIDATQRLALACIERAGGNPLFLEQLLHNAEEGSEDTIPASIQSLVLARMDRLQTIDRQAFQAASVIGQRFELPLLRKLLDVPDYICDGLVAHALVLPEGDGFLFAHALIKEGAYSSLLRGRRRDLHRIAAAWFAAQDPALRAQHLDRAGDERAPRAYLEASASQRLSYHADAALRLAERGLEIVQIDDERHELMCLKGELQRDLGDITASIATYRQAIGARPNEVSLCRAQLGLAEGLRVSEGLDEALALLDNAQDCAERHDLVPELARLHHLRGNILFPLGRIEGCRAEHERGLAYAQRSASPEAEARALGGLADAAYAQGRMRTAFAHFNRCVELSHAHGFGRIEVANRSMAGFSRIYLNQPRQACDDAAAAVRSAALVGQPRAEMLGETLNVFAGYELGEYDRMRVHLERELRLIRQLGARRFEAQNFEMQGRLQLHSGRREEAVTLLRQAMAIAREIGLQFSGPKALGALSRAVKRRRSATSSSREGEELLQRGSVGHNHLWFYRDAMEAMLAGRNLPAALRYADLLEAYVATEPLPWSEIFVARCRGLAGAQFARADERVRPDLTHIRAMLVDSGLRAFLAPVDAALAH